VRHTDNVSFHLRCLQEKINRPSQAIVDVDGVRYGPIPHEGPTVAEFFDQAAEGLGQGTLL
jgi:hypothetical protein